MAFVEVAVAIILGRVEEGNGERLLICQRKAGTVLGGYWEFPGGKRLEEEALEACCVREIREEVGIEIQVLGRLPRIEHVYPHARVRLNPFVCRHVSGEVRHLAVADARWLMPGEIGGYRFPEANGALVEAAGRGAGYLLGVME